MERDNEETKEQIQISRELNFEGKESASKNDEESMQIRMEDSLRDFETPEKLSRITESMNESTSVRRCELEESKSPVSIYKS